MQTDATTPNNVGVYGSDTHAGVHGTDTLGTLRKDVVERRTSTGSEAFSLSICLDANKLVLLSFFSLLKTIYPRVSTKPLPNDAKSPLPVDVRRSKTLLLMQRLISYRSGFSSLEAMRNTVLCKLHKVIKGS